MAKEQRIAKIFNLPLSLTVALDERSKASGEKMSRIAERGIRMALALPPVEEESERGFGPTRSELVVLEILTRCGVMWTSDMAIAAAAGLTLAGTTKAIKALERDGKAFCWGPARIELAEGERLNPEIRMGVLGWARSANGSTAWGAMPPLKALERALAVWRQGGDRLAIAAIIMRQALGVADIVPFREASRVLWAGIKGGGDAIMNFAELEAEGIALDQEAREAEEAARVREEEARRVTAAQVEG